MVEGYNNAGQRIYDLRVAQDISRSDLAKKAHISTKFLYEIETCKKGFSAKTLLKLAKVLKTDCDYILTGKKKRNSNKSKKS